LIHVGQVRYFERRYPEAIEVFRKTLSLAPNTVAPQLMGALAHGLAGQVDAGLEDLRKLEPRYPQGRMYEAMTLAIAGRREEAMQVEHPFEENIETAGIPMQWFALFYGFLNDRANAVKWLHKSADGHESQVLNMGVNPAFTSMRTAPDFVALERWIGLAK
jgi:hypothetical protein